MQTHSITQIQNMEERLVYPHADQHLENPGYTTIS